MSRRHDPRPQRGERTGARVAIAAIALVAAALAIGGRGALARPVTFAQPPDSSTLKQAPGAGYLKTEALCATCHSRDYIATQPLHKGKEFWAAEITKMVNVYGAPIPEADRPAIAEY